MRPRVMSMGPTDPVNPYQPPKAELDVVARVPVLPASIEDAIAGRYDFRVADVMGDAWQLTKGFKASFWGAAVIVGIVYLVVQTIFAVVLGMFITERPNALVRSVFNGIVGALMTPMMMGLQMMCVRRALGAPVSFATAFSYFSRAGTALVGGVLVLLLTYAGLALLVIPGIYLGTAYLLTTQLIGDQEMSAWQAMETSRKAITHRWLRVLGLWLLVGLLTGLSALGLLVPLVWTLPWAMMVTGVLYRRIFYASSMPTGLAVSA
jgi:hypothetical protein